MKMARYTETSMAADPVIDIRKLSKRYRTSATYALKDLTLKVMPGEVYGFLGPNGAGKSTAIRTLLNFIQPTSGTATILGKDIVKESVAIKSSIGYLSSDMAMYPKMTGAHFIRYMSELQGQINTSYVSTLIKSLQADTTKRVGDLSRGNRQKIAIVQAFMNKPNVLILDEASSGLDPLMQEVFFGLIHEAKQRGAAIFMSSHILSEVQKICDKVGIIREGELITERGIAEMAQEAAHTFDVVFRSDSPIAELKRLRGVKIEAHDDHRMTIRYTGELAPFLSVLATHDIAQLEVRQLDLEELFLHFYKEGRH